MNLQPRKARDVKWRTLRFARCLDALGGSRIRSGGPRLDTSKVPGEGITTVMASPRPDVVDLLDVHVAPGGKVIALSDLHLPPERTEVSGRCAELLSAKLAGEASVQPAASRLTVVLAGDIVEMLANPGRSAHDMLEAHADLCQALARVTERGGQVIYTVGNHDGDLAWDLKAATAVRDVTGAKLCLAADLVFPNGTRVRVEHGHQIDPYNCFHDARNPL